MRVKVIALFKVDDDGSTSLLTIVKNKKQARAYAAACLRLEKINHFKLWCEYRKLDVRDASVWNQYVQDCVTEKELKAYRAKICRLNKDFILSTLRDSSKCLPLGCGYEDSSEYLRLIELAMSEKDNPEIKEYINNIKLIDNKLDDLLNKLNFDKE